MKTFIKTLLFSSTFAATVAFANVTVDNAWVRATVPNQQATGAFLNITSDKDAKLIGAHSPVMPNTEIHEMVMENNIMKMRQVQSVDLPAGKTVELKPGGHHIMFLGLTEQIKEGATIPLTLEIENNDGTKEAVEVQATVRALTSGGPSGHGAHDHGAQNPGSHGHGDTHDKPHGNAHGSNNSQPNSHTH